MKKMPIDWATILSDNLNDKLVSIKENPWLYMTSHLVYLLVARTIDYLSFYKKGIMEDANACPYVVYP